MRKKVVAGNWKMNKDLQESLGLTTEIKGMVKDEVRNDAEIILFPPFISLSALSKNLEGNERIKLGAQNMHQEDSGAFTGEVSASMLKSVGCKYVIIGHSERRQYFGESNELLNLKVKKAIQFDLIPVYCIGETLEERESGFFWDVLSKQIEVGLMGLDNAIAEKIIIAYEPVWAIGTGKTASTAQAQEVHLFVRNQLKTLFGTTFAENVRILYGGSVKPENAFELFSAPDIDGGLIGGAALKSRDFCEIVKSAQ
jgi:triosephosphate isomerase